MKNNPNTIIQRESELIAEMNLLSAKHIVNPLSRIRKRMNQIFAELLELTGDEKYKL